MSYKMIQMWTHLLTMLCIDINMNLKLLSIQIKGFGATAREWAREFYDVVWALTYALNKSLVDLNMSLAEFKVGSSILAEVIKKTYV